MKTVGTIKTDSTVLWLIRRSMMRTVTKTISGYFLKVVRIVTMPRVRRTVLRIVQTVIRTARMVNTVKTAARTVMRAM